MIPMNLNEIEKDIFKNSNTCHICEKGEFNYDKIMDKKFKVREHCHLTGTYRGAAHNACNLNLKLPQNIPVLCHNAKNYDTHLYIKELAKKYGKVELLANTDEKYINYSVNTGFAFNSDKGNESRKFIKLSFVDTYRFMDSSIDKLSKGLKNFKHI